MIGTAGPRRSKAVQALGADEVIDHTSNLPVLHTRAAAGSLTGKTVVAPLG